MLPWLLRGATPADDEKLASDLAEPGFHLKRTQPTGIESKDHMQKRGPACAALMAKRFHSLLIAGRRAVLKVSANHLFQPFHRVPGRRV